MCITQYIHLWSYTVCSILCIYSTAVELIKAARDVYHTIYTFGQHHALTSAFSGRKVVVSYLKEKKYRSIVIDLVINAILRGPDTNTSLSRLGTGQPNNPKFGIGRSIIIHGLCQSGKSFEICCVAWPLSDSKDIDPDSTTRSRSLAYSRHLGPEKCAALASTPPAPPPPPLSV